MVVDSLALMKKYLNGTPELPNDEREVLLFALYVESKARGGLAADAIR